MGSFFEAFVQYKFLQNALLGGLIIGSVCSLFSPFVVLKRMAFIGEGIGHAAFGGIALALLLISDPSEHEFLLTAITMVYCLAVAFLIAYSSRTKKISEDSAIGIFLAVSMALGLILLSTRKAYTAEILSYLFGSILAISRNDILIIGLFGALVLFFILGFYKELVFFTFDESSAKASGIPTGFLHYMLIALLAILIVAAVKLVGVILVTAYLIIPGATAKLFAKKFSHLSVGALSIGILTSFLGLFASYKLNFPSGASIVVVQFLLFVFALALSKFRGKSSVKNLKERADEEGVHSQ